MDAVSLIDAGRHPVRRGRRRHALLARVDAIESAAAGVRLWVLARLVGNRPQVHRHADDGRRDAACERTVERLLWRVHDAARDAHAEWRDDGDVDAAMTQLSRALSVASEFTA